MAGTAQEEGKYSAHQQAEGRWKAKDEQLGPRGNKNRDGIMKGTRSKGGCCGANGKGWYYVDNL